MNILVLGGTRFFGKTLVEQLGSAGHAVTVLSRGKLPPPAGAAAHVSGALEAIGDRTGHYVLTSTASWGSRRLRRRRGWGSWSAAWR